LNRPEHVIVLGAGPGGLACAHELAANGIRSTVLERNDYVGGLCRTVEHAGYRFDLGGHRWFTKNVDLHNWFLRLMEGELVSVDRISRIYHNGKYYNYPLRVGDVLRNSTLWEIFLIMWGFGMSILRSAVTTRPVRNMEEAYVAQFGRPLYEMFFRTYSEKVWGRPCDQLSADWVSQRSAGLSVTDLVKDALFKKSGRKAGQKPGQKPGKGHESLIDQFVYPRNGYVRVAERLAEDVRAAGSEVRLNCAVTRIVEHGPDRYEVFVSDGGKESSLTGDAVVSTIPLGLLVRILEPAPSGEVIACAKALEFRDLITVTVMLDIPQVSRDSWVYVQDREVVFGRFHEPGNWSSALVPDENHTSLVLECFCSRGDEIWEMSDEDLVARCVDDLVDKLNFLKRENVIDSCVVRTVNTYPVYDLEYAHKTGTIKQALQAYEGLHIVGRGGTFRYNNSDHSIEMGLLLAQKLSGRDVDHLAVNLEQEYHEMRTSEGLQRDRFVKKTRETPEQQSG